MTYEWREHTAEVELVVTGGSPEQIFRDAADAFEIHGGERAAGIESVPAKPQQ